MPHIGAAKRRWSVSTTMVGTPPLSQARFAEQHPAMGPEARPYIPSSVRAGAFDQQDECQFQITAHFLAPCGVPATARRRPAPDAAVITQIIAAHPLTKPISRSRLPPGNAVSGPILEHIIGLLYSCSRHARIEQRFTVRAGHWPRFQMCVPFSQTRHARFFELRNDRSAPAYSRF